MRLVCGSCVCGCAQVLAAGPGAYSREGKLLPMSLKVGDKVLLPEYGGQPVTLSDKEEYVLFRDEDILAKIDE